MSDDDEGYVGSGGQDWNRPDLIMKWVCGCEGCRKSGDSEPS